MSTAQTVPNPLDSFRRSPHLVAVFAAVFTWPLLFVGGLVTSYKVGMAVPDWPTTFGINMFVYNFFDSSWGVFIEHTHRLYGAAVGLATIVLVIWFIAFDRSNKRMLGLVWFAFFAVICQGVLGGLRVNRVSTMLAAVHGSTGQAFFGLMVAIAVMTSRSWRTAHAPVSDPSRLRVSSVVLVGLIYLQELAGSWLRHFPSRMSLIVHGLFAIAVFGHAVAVTVKARRNREMLTFLNRSRIALTITIGIQIALGLAAWWVLEMPRALPDLSALIRTGHQANGALLLGSSIALALQSLRHLEPVRSEKTSVARVHAELEAVA